jgi:hypothetical protein
MTTTRKSVSAKPETPDDLGLEILRVIPWFPHDKDAPYVLVRVSEQHAKTWADLLGVAVRRCYVSDAVIEARAKAARVSKETIVAAKLPDAGSTMAGDFGEILVYFYQASKEHPSLARGPRKWRLKQDRTKPAPHSDVVQFVLPTWPSPSDKDVLFCSEVKTKSTDGDSSPIKKAIEDCTKDRTSRLAGTLVWLRDRALLEDLGDVSLEQLNRFINATEHPAAQKRFRAVAVICSSLVEAELADAPTAVNPEYSVVVIAVPDLKKTYTAVFDSVHKSVAATPPVKAKSLR